MSENKYRDFWLALEHHQSPIVLFSEPIDADMTNIVHVVEYSALEHERMRADKLMRALEFYANGNHYDMRPGLGAIIGDTGTTARKAIKEFKG